MTGYIGLKSKTLTNLLDNGFVSNNRNYWTIDSQYNSLQYIDTTTGNYSYFTVTLNSTVNTSNTGTLPCYQLFDSISGSTAATRQVIYCQAKVHGRSSNTSWPRVYLREYKNGSSTATYNSNLSAIDGSTGSELNNKWHTMSGHFHTYNPSTGDYWSYDRAAFGINVSNTEGDSMDIKDFIIVNLTAAFGRGNEPSKADCDNYMTVSGYGKIYYQGLELAAESVAHNISKMYIGIDGVAHRIKKAYIGVNNVARLWYKLYPTFEELFTNAYVYSYRGGRSDSSTAKLSLDLSGTSGSGALTAGQTWFALFSCGGSLEITKLYVDSTSSITRTQLSLTTASGETSQVTSISGTTLSSSNSIYSGVIIAFLFNYNIYPVHTVEYMFRNCLKQKLKYYYASSTSSTAASSSNTRYATGSVSPPGILIPMFYSSGACVSISTCDNPLTPIRALGTTNSNVALVQQTYSSTNYFYPSKDGSAIVGVRSYTLNRLYEDWL